MTINRQALVILALFVLVSTPGVAQEDSPTLIKPFLYDKLLIETPAITPAEFDPRAIKGRDSILRTIDRNVHHGTLLGTDAESEAERIRRQFVGNWKLLTFESRGEDGDLRLRPMAGRIMYDEDGNMAAQLMPEAEPDDRGRRRYITYFGRFSIDATESKITHHVEASIFDRWVGTDLVRHYAFEESESGMGRLTLSVFEGETETTRLVWERLGE